MPTERQAVALLEDLGLTEYEARCFIALSRVPTATASEIASLSDVPRSRVYDAVDRLHRRGLVEVQQSDPRAYRSISREGALEMLRSRHEDTLEAVDEALSGLHRTDELEQAGAWAVADRDRVNDRIDSFLEEATEEVYILVGDEGALDPLLRDGLNAAIDDGVTTIVEAPTEELRDRVRAEIPDATVRVTALAGNPAALERKRMGRIVMVDRRSVLLSAMADRDAVGSSEETAVWASGPDHGLVVGIRHVLGSRIDDELGGSS